MKNDLTWNDFEKVKMRVGTIIEANDFPEARNPSYKLLIDFGEKYGVKSSSAQITRLYSKEEIIGTQVVAVVNFPPKRIANFMSECLVLGAVKGTDVTLISPNKPVINGFRIE